MIESPLKIIECPRDAMQGLLDFIPTKIKAAYINQLLKVGVVALDARCLDLKSVDECQRVWCGDAWGNILF